MYLKWNKKIISDFSESGINALYNQGYLFGRVEKGYMYQTRSLRINLELFQPSSENRRVLKKMDSFIFFGTDLPYASYNWRIGKFAKNFYESKFGSGTFSANKIKELMTEPQESNFNYLLICEIKKNAQTDLNDSDKVAIGYCVCYQNSEFIHYSYPFYNSSAELGLASIGIGMMTRAIVKAQEQGKKYLYLGSASRPTDTYKLQFAGLEWFNGQKWERDLEKLKTILVTN